MATLSWLLSMLTFATVLAFNLFAMDALMRMRGDVSQIRKATSALMHAAAPPDAPPAAAQAADAVATLEAAAPAAQQQQPAGDPAGKKVQD